MQPYDLVVIGSGPGGLRAAIQAAKSGKHVAVVEKQTMVGGVCINTGTIPSKTMREAVLHLSGFNDQAFYGSGYHAKESITMSDLNFRVNRVIENEAAVLKDQLTRNSVDLFHGVGSFTDLLVHRTGNLFGRSLPGSSGSLALPQQGLFKFGNIHVEAAIPSGVGNKVEWQSESFVEIEGIFPRKPATPFRHKRDFRSVCICSL